MRHLLSTHDLNIKDINHILDTAINYKNTPPKQTLENKIITTIFFENSTRTLSSFESAAKNLGGKVLRVDISKSSTSKGESMADTAANINAMSPSAIVIRHKNAGAGEYLANYVSCPIINGGDGAHAHPTQALLDAMTMKLHFKGDLRGKRIAIVGDILNSRVASSGIDIFSKLGMQITLVAPPHFQSIGEYDGIKKTTFIEEVIDEIDIIMSLRTQTERHNMQIYGSLKDYAHKYCITKKLLQDRDIIVLHPGPVHRNIDISDEVLEDKRSKVLEQVANGVFIRMAVLEILINQKEMG